VVSDIKQSNDTQGHESQETYSGAAFATTACPRITLFAVLHRVLCYLRNELLRGQRYQPNALKRVKRKRLSLTAKERQWDGVCL
jgi:hypothetical protein